jgi:hypothetical protein
LQNTTFCQTVDETASTGQKTTSQTSGTLIDEIDSLVRVANKETNR